MVFRVRLGGNPAHLAATVPGVVHLHIAPGDEFEPGQRIAVIEAMKMEAPIISTRAGIIATTAVPTGSQVEPGDLIATITLTNA